jgi:uncharacterized membrane protein
MRPSQTALAGRRLKNDDATSQYSAAKEDVRLNLVLWTLIGLYAVARVLQVFPGKIPMLAVVGLHVVCPAIFAVIHGARVYGWRGICVFVGISLVVGNVFENLGVTTGFPFGHYAFTDVMGPKVFFVPVLLGLAYVGMAYLAWILALVILGVRGNPPAGWRVVTLPLVASVLMVAWDFSQEPVWATVVKAWIWTRGGPYFGVPWSNFAGWFLTVYILYQLFALYVERVPEYPRAMPLNFWRQAIVFYAVSASGNLLLLIPAGGAPTVVDASGAVWKLRDIFGACAVASVFTMGTFAVVAWARLMEQPKTPEGKRTAFP